MKTTFGLFIFTCSAVSQAASISPGHPIIGTWRVHVPGTQCFETNAYHVNGTQSARSATEIAESRFLISASPDSAGFYELTDTVVKSNGLPDCSGISTPIGDTVTVFVRFEEAGDAFMLCYTRSANRCVGPYTRVAEASPP
jgi:hypothetical protein